MGYAAGAGPDTIDLVSTSGSSDVTSESESRETSESGSHVDSSGLSSHHFNNEQTGMQEYNAKDKASVIKHELLAHYSAQTSSATFATSGACPDAVNPCLSVTGIGTVGLPLSDRDAKAIIGASRQAPYGKGTETFVDTSVRKTWEIDADAFQVRNAAWPKFLEGILKKVSHDLGIIGGSAAIEARPYKMLLYEEGAMFKPHKEYVVLGVIAGEALAERSIAPRKKIACSGRWSSVCLPSIPVGRCMPDSGNPRKSMRPRRTRRLTRHILPGTR